MKHSTCVLALAAFSCAIQIFAATAPAAGRQTAAVPVKYYVSEKGFDANNGLSPEKAFRNIQRAADVTGPGDIVYVMDGVYKRDEPTRPYFITLKT